MATARVRTAVGLLLAGLFLSVAACGGGGGDQAGVNPPSPEPTTAKPTETGQASPTEPGGPTPTNTPTVVPTPVVVSGVKINYHGQTSVVGERKTTIELHDNYFEPSVILGSPGQELDVELVNEGSVKHTFTVKQGGVDVVVAPGDTKQVTVKFPESDRRAFLCRFHIDGGMGGVLVVTRT